MFDYGRYLAIADLEARAVAFARDAHGSIDHRRKYTDAPYVEHPLAVAEIVRRRPHTPAMIAAAVVHDTVEDTLATIQDVAYLFGIEVAWLVDGLTDVARPWQGNRAARKAVNRMHTAAAAVGAKTVKCADGLDNGRDILEHDPDFAVAFFREIALLCAGPLDGADPVLLAELRELVAAALPKLEAAQQERQAARRDAHAQQVAEARERKRAAGQA